MLHAVEFVSQVGGKHERVGCGPASLMMLLRHHRLPTRVPTYRELCEMLWLTVNPEIKGWRRSHGRGAYPADLLRALKGMCSLSDEGIDFSRIETDRADQALRRITGALRSSPVMCAMKGKGFGEANGHWVVMIGRDGDSLRYLDPLSRRGDEKLLPRARFPRHWDGYGIFLRHPCRCAS